MARRLSDADLEQLISQLATATDAICRAVVVAVKELLRRRDADRARRSLEYVDAD